MVPAASAQSSAVGSPDVPGPNSTTSSPAAAWSSSRLTTHWSMQIRPTMVRRAPPDWTGPPLDACRGSPSPYPSGTSPSVDGRGAVQVRPYETPAPAGTRFTIASRARNVMAGLRPSSAEDNVCPNGDRPYVATPGRTRLKCVPGSARVAPELARCLNSASMPNDSATSIASVKVASCDSFAGLFGSSEDARCDQTPLIS